MKSKADSIISLMQFSITVIILGVGAIIKDEYVLLYGIGLAILYVGQEVRFK